MNRGGKTSGGSAAETKRRLRSRATTIISPISRASGVPSAIWRLCLALADWCPAVTRPSTHFARSISSRQRATCASVRTEGKCSSMSEAPGPGEQVGARRPRDRVGRMHAIGVALVRDVDDVGAQLERLDRSIGDRDVAARVPRDLDGVDVVREPAAGVERAAAHLPLVRDVPRGPQGRGVPGDVRDLLALDRYAGDDVEGVDDLRVEEGVAGEDVPAWQDRAGAGRGGLEWAGYFVRISLSDFVMRRRYSWPR